jgi:hypothetical protein
MLRSRIWLGAIVALTLATRQGDALELTCELPAGDPVSRLTTV